MKQRSSASKRLFSLILAVCLVTGQATAVAENPNTDEGTRRAQGIYFVGEDSGACATTSSQTITAGGSGNTDYAGRPVLTEAQLQQVEENRPTYEQAANQVGVPWQMIAVVHLREFGLKRENPSNGQGMYQFFDKHGGPYPAGPVSDAEFLRQTILAAEFIKAKAGSNLSQNRNIAATGTSADTVKDTFFGYNGRSSKYAQQGAQFGFDPATQPFEGSPYVMNKADRNRDPEFNTRTWGQVKRDNGPIEYPANNDYGAFVSYSVLAGVSPSSTSGDCHPDPLTNGSATEKIVAIARQELAAGAHESDGSNTKYGGGRGEAWCGYFVGWVFEQAGADTGGTRLSPAVSGILDYARQSGTFHAASEANFTPQPGDVAIYKEGLDPYPSHVNIVIAFDAAAGTYTAIGGNEGDGVRQGDHSLTSPALTGFMRLP